MTSNSKIFLPPWAETGYHLSPFGELGIVLGSSGRSEHLVQMFGKCWASGSLCTPEALSPGLDQMSPHSVKVSAKVSSSVRLNPVQRPARVGFTWVGGSHRSVRGVAGPVRIGGRSEGRRIHG